MENYRFLVKSEKLREQIVAFLVDKKYDVKLDEIHPKEELDCFVFWADGTKRCIITKCSSSDNRMIIFEENIDWFLKQL